MEKSVELSAQSNYLAEANVRQENFKVAIYCSIQSLEGIRVTGIFIRR